MRLVLVGPPGAQLGPGDAVERAGRDAVAQSEATQSITQLGRGLPGEGEGEDVALVGVGGADAPGDAPREDPGLAGSRGRQDRERPRRRRHRTPLCLVEIVEQVFGRHRSRPYATP